LIHPGPVDIPDVAAPAGTIRPSFLALSGFRERVSAAVVAASIQSSSSSSSAPSLPMGAL
jgi:hypothetical protein